MPVRRRPGCAPSRASQRGQAILFVALLVGVGVGLFTYGAVRSVSLNQQQDVKTRLAMTLARDALIGWSVARTTTGALPNARPGELPCPDNNNDGFEDGSCVAGAIGRVPWKTLGIPEPKDDAGETLWYAIAGPFRIWNLTFTAINSDTKGNVTVYADSTATPLTREAVAVLFAPGPAVGAQIRDATAALCPTTGTTIARNLCAANYLETAAGVNNAINNGPFISAQSSAGFNDRLLVITTTELMPSVEQRVGRELRGILSSYKTATAALGYNAGAGVYPWADLSNGFSDAPPYEVVGVGRNRGRVPAFGASPRNWGDPGPPVVPTLPAWFVNNDWRLVTYYSAGQNFLEAGGCSTCVNPTLSVDGVSGKEVVILMPGPAGPSRPPAVPLSDPTFWSYYLEDGPNSDQSDDLYVTPSSTAYTRDRIYAIP
ncbi:MAG: hypothetical protein HYU76_02395 [Betaproteobacteria bacterium]|nr:hypothetical protein [Betaproteobacteria bacterium]